ncbi:carbohydrate ABC transporter permease [Bacillus sp. T33-2]|uniref:carbohydrate ABC transporter permease n=1 Tax=Bacillus sp. T33-2 TaxID=2054168 RepID=UPI000C78BD75|nr:sugar ABC transporter permease [Bacillus sp. T33-2]PLR94675.1 sugar ABC transporter permease [Bacillus sp. T33-2]
MSLPETKTNMQLNINTKKKKVFTQDRIVSLIFLLPSLIGIGIFVYGFIFWTGYLSLSHANTAAMDMSFAGLKNYLFLFDDFRFQSDFRNTLVFTILFVITSIVLGIVMSAFIDSKIKGSRFFQNLFIFPMAMSFIVTGAVWQWLLNPSTGYNKILQFFGVENLPLWYVNPKVLLSFPFGDIEFGIPVAQISLVIAALWQMSGFVMAMYLSGLRGIDDSYKEAARIDGATELQIFFKVILPLLRPITISAVIIVGHISLKIFDLIYVMTGPGNGYVTDMPGVYMFETTFRGHHYGQGAAIAMLMLLFVSLLIIPYLISNRRKEVEE